jgi:hypothetical protein
VTGDRIKSQSEELHTLYFSSYIIRMIRSRRIRWMRHVGCMGLMRNTCKILAVMPEGKQLLGRPGCKWEDNSKMKLKEIGWNGVN